jgi:hypothetical protein
MAQSPENIERGKIITIIEEPNYRTINNAALQTKLELCKIVRDFLKPKVEERRAQVIEHRNEKLHLEQDSPSSTCRNNRSRHFSRNERMPRYVLASGVNEAGWVKVLIEAHYIGRTSSSGSWRSRGRSGGTERKEYTHGRARRALIARLLRRIHDI